MTFPVEYISVEYTQDIKNIYYEFFKYNKYTNVTYKEFIEFCYKHTL